MVCDKGFVDFKAGNIVSLKYGRNRIQELTDILQVFGMFLIIVHQGFFFQNQLVLVKLNSIQNNSNNNIIL